MINDKREVKNTQVIVFKFTSPESPEFQGKMYITAAILAPSSQILNWQPPSVIFKIPGQS